MRSRRQWQLPSQDPTLAARDSSGPTAVPLTLVMNAPSRVCVYAAKRWRAPRQPLRGDADARRRHSL
jgi:hypothetical protein